MTVNQRAIIRGLKFLLTLTLGIVVQFIEFASAPEVATRAAVATVKFARPGTRLHTA